MDVIVVGAGIGGLALATGLCAAGHRVRVLERADGPRAGGAAVTVFSNGKAAAAELTAPLDGLGGRIDTLELRGADDRRYGVADLRIMARRTGFTVETVPRAALLRRLADGLPAGTVRYGAAVAGAVASGTVTCADGTHHTADVVVGADGYRSAVRRAVLGDAGARRNGWSSWQGLTPVTGALSADAPVPDLLRRYEKVRARRVRRVSRLAATEATNREPTRAGRIAWKVLSPGLTGLAYHALIRRFSSVLNSDAI